MKREYRHINTEESLMKDVAGNAVRHTFPDFDDATVDLVMGAALILDECWDNNIAGDDFIHAVVCTWDKFEVLRDLANTLPKLCYVEMTGNEGDAYGMKITSDLAVAMNDLLSSLDRLEFELSDEPITELGIDIETYSSVDIKSCGAYRYVDSDDFEILLFCCSVNGGPVITFSLAEGEQLPQRITDALTDPQCLKTAFNAAFERVCLSKYLGVHLDPRQWECTMVKCAMLGLPLSLDAVCKVIYIRDKKMMEGKALIKYFSVPCKATKVNGGRTRNLPEHDPTKWETFKRYCRRDVEAEQEIRRKLSGYVIPESERALYAIDQDINDRGVMVDMTLVGQAIAMDAVIKAKLNAEACQLTGLDNPNSLSQLKGWLEDNTGEAVDTLSRKDIPDMIKSIDDEKVTRMLEIRQQMGKTSTKKYEAMRKAVCSDGRVHGLLQFYGASRTGRWAGRLVQAQNLPQNHIKELDLARELVKAGDTGMVELTFGDVCDTLSQLIRTAFIAKPGCTFHVCDFSAIEARVIAWLAGEEWVLDVFRKGGDVYCATASQMFGVPVEKHGQNAELRQKGKIAVLALGYGGGVNALEAMGGARMGLTQPEMEEIVSKWRTANPHIVKLWRDVEGAAKTVINTAEPVSFRGLTFRKSLGMLMIQLPSGRSLSYPKPAIGTNRFGSPSISYEGVSQTTKQWCKQETYGGKLTENIIQAIARDCLAVTMMRLEEAGYPIVFHVHDECIVESFIANGTLDAIQEIFAKPIPWAPGLPLKGAGYSTKYYLKD